MLKQFSYVLLFLGLSVLILNCANRGTPQGGEKDIEPPKIIKSVPKNFATNFQGDEILINFDEYIKLKELSKQLIISPPMNTSPNITPIGAASKSLKIKIYDTLQPNTTYAFNFGNSIVDNNEENPFTYFRYIFSTGNYIDSLTVKGRIKDAIMKEIDPFVSVMLYEANDTYTDSLIYKQKPKYITNTLDSSTTFSIENVKAGKYVLLALKDKNKDNKFQQKTDKIAFYKEVITVPSTNSCYDLTLFTENRDYKARKPRLISGEKIVFGFEGDHKMMSISALSKVPNNFQSRVIKDPKTDSLYYFYKPKLTVDSLIFIVTNQKIIDTFSVKIKNNKKDSLVVSSSPIGAIGYDQDFKISANIPFKKFNNNKIKILDKDSLNITFTSTYDTLSNNYKLSFKKTEDNQYKIKIFPEALVDFFGNKNDTLSYHLRTEKQSNFGNLRVQLEQATYPVIIQLTNDKNEVIHQRYAEENKPIDFVNLKPSTFNLRIIFDSNKNKVYDPGRFLNRQQPERVIYSNNPIEIRAGWDEITTFNLNKN